MVNTTTLSHPSIGTITANAKYDDVTRYLGLQYATLADRFAPPQLKEYSQTETIDATKPGPHVLARPDGAEFEFSLLQHSLDHDPDHGAERMSDVNGLNLNVYAPVGHDVSAGSSSLPVLVFIHGGGFNGGSSSFPPHDMSRLVRLSIAKGTPTVAVSLNYRVGAPGFLHSAELRQEGYLPNNGFRDQRAALLWLQKHIRGFGGDPDNVTLMGESAGAVSVAVHLHSKQPLFKRAMLMSGSTLLMGPVPTSVAEANYQKATKALNLNTLSAEERVQKLVSMDGQQLRTTLMGHGVASLPLLDGDLCPVAVDFKAVIDGSLDLPGREWCDSILLGDCAFDGSILGLPLGRKKAGIAKTFVASITESLREETAGKLLTGYGIAASTDEDTAFERVLQFGGDVSFYAPTLAFAQGLQKDMPTYMYRLNEPNDWPGPWQGRATHIHDLTYLFQNFNEFLSGEQSQVAEEFATDVLRFASGQAPWQNWTEDQKVAKVFATKGGGVKEDVSEQNGRRKLLVDLADEVGFDALSGALRHLMTS